MPLTIRVLSEAYIHAVAGEPASAGVADTGEHFGVNALKGTVAPDLIGLKVVWLYTGLVEYEAADGEQNFKTSLHCFILTEVSPAVKQNTFCACNSQILLATLSKGELLAFCSSSLGYKQTFGNLRAANRLLHAISRILCKANNELYAALH